MENCIGGNRFIISTALTTHMKPGFAFMTFRETASPAPVAIFPLQIEQILFAIALLFKGLIKLLNRYPLEHTKYFSPKLLIILVLK